VAPMFVGLDEDPMADLVGLAVDVALVVESGGLSLSRAPPCLLFAVNIFFILRRYYCGVF
jgi:hypothetical protein